MKTKAAVGRVVPSIIGLLAFAAWYYAVKQPSEPTVYSTATLTAHWRAIFVYFAVLFGLAFLVLVIGFWTRLSRLSILFAGLNVGTAWILVSLYFITSDSFAHSELAQIGLGTSKWLFLIGGIVWSVVAFFQIGREIDASRNRD